MHHHRATQSLRIAVLECDALRPRAQQEYGGYSGLFDRVFREGIERYEKRHGLTAKGKGTLELDLRKYDVVGAEVYPQLDGVDGLEALDGIVVSGSRYNAFDNEPWILKLLSYLRTLLDAQSQKRSRTKIIGVCFGHQVLARALGLEVARSTRGWELSVSEVRLTDRGREVFGAADEGNAENEGDGKVLTLHQFHQDSVHPPSSETTATPTETPPVEILGSSDHCAVQALYSPQRYLTVQGHPEYNREVVSELLEIRLAAGVLTQSVYDDAMARVGHKPDFGRIAEAFVRFLVDE